MPRATREVERDRSGNLHGRLDDLFDASLVSLARAVNAFREANSEDVTRLFLYDLASEDFWPEVAPVSPVAVAFFGDRLRIEISTKRPPEAPERPQLHRVLAPLLRRGNAVMSATRTSEVFGVEEIDLVFAPLTLRANRLRDVYHLAIDARDLAEAVLARGALDAHAIADLVRVRRADLLVGQRESQVFDAKSGYYQLDDDDGKLELAKDVAAFANTGRSAVIVLGLRTRGDHQGDRVSAAPGLPKERLQPGRFRQVVASWVYPPPEGMSFLWHGEEKGFLVVLIPSQPSELQPFLVRRGRLGRSLSEEQFTLPVRQGEDTSYRDIGRLHSLLVAGRAALAGPGSDLPTCPQE